MTSVQPDDSSRDRGDTMSSAMELNDDDILDAMQHIPGYLDITTDDFRSIYQLAYRHAMNRFFKDATSDRLMRQAIPSLRTDETMEAAAKRIANSGYKGLPVVNAAGYVIGMLTETDFLKRLNAAKFLDLITMMKDESCKFTHDFAETLVGTAMTQPVVTVIVGTSFQKTIDAFSRHGGHSMPVVGPDGKLLGLLLRKDVLSVYRGVDLR